MHRVRTITTGVAGSPYYTNVYFPSEDPSDAADAVASMALFWTAIRSQITASLTFQVQPDVAVVDPATGDILNYVSTAGATVTGSGVGDIIPLSNQVLVRLNTSAVVRNRRLRGRIFVPGTLEADCTGGRPSANMRSIINTAANEFATRASIRPLVWSRPTGGSGEGAGGETSPTTSGVTWTEYAVLRSRRD